MEFPEFTDDLLTGFEGVDRQHRVLFKVARKVLAVRAAAPEEVFKASSFLVSYVHYHFTAEERAMEMAGYPRLESHKRQHDLIRKDVDGIREATLAREEPQKLLLRIQMLLDDWFLPHINGVDRPFAEYLSQNPEAWVAVGELASARALIDEGRLSPEHATDELDDQ